MFPRTVLPRTVELAFARFQAHRDPRALAIVFDRTAAELLRVARHLASREADAEDLVQATFLQAIESADDHRGGQPVLPWLLGILTNRAHAARRRARRVPDPRRLRGEAVGDAQREAEVGELNATVAAALTRLPEVYRPVLRMWLEHGLEANEIARTLERPAGTVRAQVSRGLDLLRRALPHGLASGVAVAVAAGRGLAAVRTEVLARCTGTSLGFASTLLLGGLLVLHHKVLAAGIAMILGLVVWSAMSGAPPDLPVVAAAGGAAVTPATGTLPISDAPTPEAPVRAEVTDAAAPPAEAEAAAAAAAVYGELVVELVSAADGRPLPGLGVAVQHADDRDTFSRHSRWLPTDAQGVITFAQLRPATWHIDVDRLGSIAAGEVIAGRSVRRRVEVPDGIEVAGLVVDEQDRPVGDAEIAVHGSRFAAPIVARSDAAGRFAVDHLLPRLHLQARKAGHVASAVRLVEGSRGQRIEVTLRLPGGGRRIVGRARDAGGRPLRATVAIVAAAAVNVDFWSKDIEQQRPLYLTTDGDGAFATEEAGEARQLVLLLPDDGRAATCWQFVAAGREPAFVDLHTPPAAVLTGRVEGIADPAAVTIQVMAAEMEDLGFLANLAAMRVASVGADGSYRMDGLLAGSCSAVARRVFETIGQTELTLTAGAESIWNIAADSAALALPLRIRVRSAAPLPPTIFAMVAPHVADNSAPAIVALGPDGSANFTRRRSDGVDVVLALIPGSRMTVQLARRSDVPMSVAEVEFDLDAAQLPSRLVSGRLVDALGAPIAHEPVAVVRTGADALLTRVEATTDRDGRFATIALPAGDYRVTTGGAYAADREIGTVTLTAARDEDLGDRVVAR